jgi:hypothetical protein
VHEVRSFVLEKTEFVHALSSLWCPYLIKPTSLQVLSQLFFSSKKLNDAVVWAESVRVAAAEICLKRPDILAQALQRWRGGTLFVEKASAFLEPLKVFPSPLGSLPPPEQ